jgi:hypothetical protein
MKIGTALFRVLVAVVLLVGTVHAQGTDASKCAAAKQVAVGKKMLRKLKCYAAAAKKTASVSNVDPECLAKVEQRFVDAIANAEAKGGCVVNGDAASLENLVDACVQNVLQVTPTAPLPTTTTTLPCRGEGASCGGVPSQGSCCSGLTCVLDSMFPSLGGFCESL